ncbi:DUF2911 domain-containing protein [Parafilimonas sp.]|uniref:DUF2911 domain-containing protein n=1 Tax=Parafilimonas sp. TaxID=1969739 RepID=UPI0039E2D2E1
MKKLLSLALFSGILLMGMSANAQNDSKPPEDKTKRPSPPATVDVSTSNGVDIKIDYSQPSVKGREIGKEVEPMKGKVWRTGANEATVFEVSKNVTINGKNLPAGKYGLFSIWNGDTWTVIFNKTWNQWGAFNYKDADDILRIDVPNVAQQTPSEKMAFNVGEDGKVSLAWGNVGFEFTVQ